MGRSDTTKKKSSRLHLLTQEELSEFAKAQISLEISRYRSIVQEGRTGRSTRTRRKPDQPDETAERGTKTGHRR
jgi:hypothetical protein